MVSLAHPRRVGDASEYVAMAGRLASGKAPAMTAEEMAAFTREWAGSPAGYELQTRQLPPLRGPDGRYDLPHPWIYPLLSVPGVWLARSVGLADPWGLVAFNLALVLQLLVVGGPPRGRPVVTHAAGGSAGVVDRQAHLGPVHCVCRRQRRRRLATSGVDRAAGSRRWPEPRARRRGRGVHRDRRDLPSPPPPIVGLDGGRAARRRLRRSARWRTTSCAWAASRR